MTAEASREIISPFRPPFPDFHPFSTRNQLRHRHGPRPRASICGQCTLLHEPRPFTEGPRNATVLNNLFSQGSSTLPLQIEKTIGERGRPNDRRSKTKFFQVSELPTESLIEFSVPERTLPAFVVVSHYLAYPRLFIIR